MSPRPEPMRRFVTEPGTPYARLALAGLLGLAAAAATIGLLAGSGYVVGRAALRPGLSALVGILALVEVLASCAGRCATPSGSSATTPRCAPSRAGASGSTTA